MKLAQAQLAIVRIVFLEKEMDKAQANPAAWKRTLGCPGSRFLPEWEKLMAQVTRFYGSCSDYEAEALADYEEQLRK